MPKQEKYTRGLAILRALLAAVFFCPSVLLADSVLLSSFQAGNAGWHLGTLAAGNLDLAPDLEIVVSHRDATGAWFLDAFKYTGQRLPGFPYAAGGDQINVSPTLADLTGDGRDEILFTQGDRVVVLRPDGTTFWSARVNAANYVPTAGYQTVTNGFYWSPGGNWISRLPATAEFSSAVSPPMVVDVDGNGTREIITGWKIKPDPAGGAQDYNPFIKEIFGVGDWGTMGETWSGGVVFHDAATGTPRLTYHLHHLVEAGLAVGPAGSEGQPAGGPREVYALNDSDSVVAFDATKPFGLWGDGMLHGQFGKNQRLTSGSYQLPIDIYAADIDGDGRDEVLVAGTQATTLWQPNETILDDDGAILWRRWLPHLQVAHVHGWQNSSALIPVNPDKDNHVDVLGFNHSFEITFRYWNGIELAHRPGWPKNFAPLLPTPPVVGDVDGDGSEEILIGTYAPGRNPSTGNLHVFALDGSSKATVPVSGGVKHIPALADVDANGSLEVICRSLNGTVSVRRFAAAPAAPPSWATHRANKMRDGNLGKSLFPPGTPVILGREPAYRRASFSWMIPQPCLGIGVFRARTANGPFIQIASLTPSTTSFIDQDIETGEPYFYEVRAKYATNVVASAPFVIVPLLNRNLLANPGFEENDNSHWDRWFTGNVGMTNMAVSTNRPFQGRQSMQIRLENQGNNSTIAQFNQYGLPKSSIPVTPGQYYSFGGYFRSTGISQPSKHWLEWSSTRTASATNARPSLPWPNYFTPHFAAGSKPAEWTYVNRVFKLPAGFPNIELRHVFEIAAPGSGSVYLDNLFFRRIPSPTATNWTTLIPFGEKWRYHSATAPANWFTPAFDDSTWPLGTAKFGGGSGPTNIVTRLPQWQAAHFFRRQFRVESPDFDEFLLSATCTDDTGGVLYPLRVFLNGSEVRPSVETVSGQGNEVRHFDLTPFTSLLQSGLNTLSVLVSNGWSSWDDIAFDVSLKAIACRVQTPKLQMQTSPSGPEFCLDTPAGTIWQLQVADDPLGKNWQTVQCFTNSLGGLQCYRAPGAQQPASGGKFYRVIPLE